MIVYNYEFDLLQTKPKNQKQLFFTKDTQKTWIYQNDQWNMVSNNYDQATLYQFNKTAMTSFPALQDLSSAEKLINDYTLKFEENIYMLLCKDISYYTIFRQEDLIATEFSTLGDAVLTCVKEDLGEILSVELTEDESGIEIWFKNKDQEAFCMYLFNAKPLIVEYGGF